jgi:segregation and condensation protein A
MSALVAWVDTDADSRAGASDQQKLGRDGRPRSPSSHESGPDGASFIVDIAHFTGPLDLLLTLLREEQIDIYDIPIARIAEQFLVRIRTLQLDEAADYLEMAARLLRIKAQTLLPRHAGDEPWDDPRAELVRRLLEYQQVREVVDVLEARAETRRLRFAHPPAVASERPLAVGAPRFEAALVDLLAAVDRVMRAVRAPAVHSIVPRALDVAAAIDATRAMLAGRSRFRWSDLLDRNAEAWQILSVLLALLELARVGECSLRQGINFATIEISAQERPAAGIQESSARLAADLLSPAVTPASALSQLPPPDSSTHDTAGAAA